MPQFADRPEIRLMPMAPKELRRLAASQPVDRFASAPEGALPPPHVVVRALSQLDAGVPATWCLPFLIVDKRSGDILGGCRFKGAPVNGSVEIGYGVARSARGRGIATSAVEALLRVAVASGIVQEVVAHILPGNIPSSRVVSRLGFARGRPVVDTDGETVVRWAYSVAG